MPRRAETLHTSILWRLIGGERPRAGGRSALLDALAGQGLDLDDRVVQVLERAHVVGAHSVERPLRIEDIEVLELARLPALLGERERLLGRGERLLADALRVRARGVIVPERLPVLGHEREA